MERQSRQTNGWPVHGPRPARARIRRRGWGLALLTLTLSACGTSPATIPTEPEPTPIIQQGYGLTLDTPAQTGDTVSVGPWDVRFWELAVGAAAFQRLRDSGVAVEQGDVPARWLAAHLSITERPTKDNTEVWTAEAYVLDAEGRLQSLLTLDGSARAPGDTLNAWSGGPLPGEALPVALAVRLFVGRREAWTFFAIPGGAPLTVSALQPPPTPNTLGATPDQPAHLGDTLVTRHAAVTLEGVLWGSAPRAALPMLPLDLATPTQLDRWAWICLHVVIIGSEPLPHDLPGLARPLPPDGTSFAIAQPVRLSADDQIPALLAPGGDARYWLALDLQAGADGLVEVRDAGPYWFEVNERRYVDLLSTAP